MSEHRIIPNGTMVWLVLPKIKAMVICSAIYGMDVPHIQYNIAYFVQGRRESVWVEPMEIEVIDDNSKPAGFLGKKP